MMTLRPRDHLDHHLDHVISISKYVFIYRTSPL